ncbi:hypothetical protein C4K04_1023 [Pseudomonas chlororaphis]|uniref:Uncharacterized protein n=1 Tax=Pseudomonas chlororaphis TaxID=587753 RepID=A0A3G7TI02_9PSED|nr:hypothetical protein C4K04_1023 [Pseudomonas chlororaphis]
MAYAMLTTRALNLSCGGCEISFPRLYEVNRHHAECLPVDSEWQDLDNF